MIADKCRHGESLVVPNGPRRNSVILALSRKLANTLFDARGFSDRFIRRLATETRNKRVLEIGSGKLEKGEYPKSYKKYFDKTNEFIQSDIVAEYGHEVVDATNMRYTDEFDLVICSNVLEHIFDIHAAVNGIHQATKPGGCAAVVVPSVYPLHDEPHDYWRLTEHSLRMLLRKFSQVEIKCSGMRKLPFMYSVVATK